MKIYWVMLSLIGAALYNTCAFGQLSNVLSLTVSNRLCSSDQTIVRFLPDATDSFDSQYDAYKFMNPNNTPNIYTESDDQYAINALNDQFSEKTVLLNFKAYFAGTYCINTQMLGRFESFWSISLLDKFLQKTIDLRSDSIYTFDAQQSDSPARFVITFRRAVKAALVTAVTVSDTENRDKMIYASKDQILVDGSDFSASAVIYVSDLSGNTITQVEPQSANWSFSPPMSGIYVVNVISENQYYTKKLYISRD